LVGLTFKLDVTVLTKRIQDTLRVRLLAKDEDKNEFSLTGAFNGHYPKEWRDRFGDTRRDKVKVEISKDKTPESLMFQLDYIVVTHKDDQRYRVVCKAIDESENEFSFSASFDGEYPTAWKTLLGEERYHPSYFSFTPDSRQTKLE
jgi:bifunctional DNA-binding transcriptional regulator/antitoxin component of YhaV-PrlF toxin-antitoxin module